MDDTGQALVLIADALGISIEALPVARQTTDTRGLSLSENAELIQAFDRIDDVAVRRRVISYVQGEANRFRDKARAVGMTFWEQPGS